MALVIDGDDMARGRAAGEFVCLKTDDAPQDTRRRSVQFLRVLRLHPVSALQFREGQAASEPLLPPWENAAEAAAADPAAAPQPIVMQAA